MKYYLESSNALESFKKAGYKTKYPDKIAYRLLENPLIKRAVGDCRKKIMKQTEITFEYKLNTLNEILKDPNADLSVKIKAIEVMNKMQGDNAPEKRETNVTMDDRTKLLTEETKRKYDELQQHR